MHITRQSWLPAAQSAGWFRLDRHDDPEPADPPEPTDPEGEPDTDPDDDPDPEGADKLGDEGKRALARMKADKAAAKREAAAERRKAAEALRKVAEYEDRDKTEAERLTARAEAAEKRAEAATARAVEAEVKVWAADFADVDDAMVNVQRKLASYADADGNIDTEAIQADLAEVLERKPHLRKPAAAPEPEPKKKAPKPDPGQGPRPPAPPADFRESSKEDYEAELAKYGVTPRR